MSLRPSLKAAGSSSSTNGHTPKLPSISKISSSQSAAVLSRLPTESMDPDEIFTKHTISEIKQIQQRLSADADAKQEELRVMVGERYRDLLQSSTSIISISQSSKRVIEVLNEVKTTILSEEEPSPPKRTHLKTHSEDTHLSTLQVLAAHLKLLLDVPEHLWRLLERKNYYTAAWLFLLSRVVHRALIREDEQDAENWSTYGVDVLEQFPLVQRQWDAVSQFRSQIVHRSTMSLREHSTSAVDVCATLLTLHLLDSRPLGETLTVLLDQRWKSLQVALNSDKPISLQANGHPTNASPIDRVKTGHEVKDLVLRTLDTVSRTTNVVRDVFRDKDSKPSMIRAALEHIQYDDAANESLPAELQLSTQFILTGLPSSTQFQMLPQSLRSYKPYVDPSSSSSSFSEDILHKRLEEWFQKAIQKFKSSLDRWLADVQSVKSLWSIRSSVRSWIDSSTALEDRESEQLKTVFDEVCQKRILVVWKLMLSDAEVSFRDQLTSAVSSFRSDSTQSKSSPMESLFRAPALPVSSPAGIGSLDASFQKYRSSLCRQLLNHTSLLDGVLKILENCAKTLRQDLSQVLISNDSNTLSLIEELKGAYRPAADQLCTDIIQDLKTVAADITEKTETDIDALVFAGHIIKELTTSSNFLSDIHCQEYAAKSFQQNASTLYDSILDRWRKFTVSNILSRHKIAQSVYRQSDLESPSTHMLRSLLSLAQNVQGLGLPRSQSERSDLVQHTILLFISELIDNTHFPDDVQALRDLAFLRAIAERCASGVLVPLDEKAMQIRKKIDSEQLPSENDLKEMSLEHLSRSQLLLASLLLPSARVVTNSSPGDKFSVLLPFGTPSLEQEYRTAFDVAKPSSRFGLLLVG